MSAAPGKRLSGLEEAFARLDRWYPTGRLQIGGIARLTGQAPSLDEFREHVLPRLLSFPALGVRIGSTRPRMWEGASEQDAAGQFFTRACPSGSGPSGLRTVVEDVLAVPLRRDRPLWEVWLLHGYASDEWTALLKTHHAVLDGASITLVLNRIFDAIPAVQEPPARPLAPQTKKTDLLTVVRGTGRYLTGFFPLAGRPFSGCGKKGKRQFRWASVDRERLRRVAELHGVTVNDVFLAAVTGAIRQWPHTPWRCGRISPVWTLMPVDLHRREGDHRPGLKAAAVRTLLPCNEPDPLRRLAAIAGDTPQVKGSSRVPVTGAGLRSLPIWFQRLIFALTFSSRYVSMIASNMRGPESALYHRGVPATRLAPLGPLPNKHRLGAYLYNDAELATIGFVLDDELPDGEELCLLWVEAVTELEQAGRTASRSR